MDENLGNLNIRFTADLTDLNAGFQQASSLVKGMGDTVKAQTGKIGSIGNATNGIKNVGNAVKDTTSKVSGLSKMFGSLVRINLAVWALRGAKALTGFIGNLTKMGSDITEIENLFQVSFGSMASEANDFAQKLSDYWGVSISATKEQTAYLNNMYKQMGLTKSTAFGMATALEEMSWNLASLLNKDQVDVLNAMKSATLGISRPMKNLGVVTNVTTLQETAFRHGITSTNRELSQNEKALAAVWAIYDQTKSSMESGIDPSTGKAIGDMSKTLMTNANMMRIVKSQALELGRTWGIAFQPIAQAVLPLIIALEHSLMNLGIMFASFVGRMFGYTGDTQTVFKQMVDDFASTGTGTTGLEALADDTADIGDAAEDSKKKMDTLTGGIDELNILNDDKNKSKSSSPSLGAGGIENDIGVPNIDTIGGTALWDAVGKKVDEVKGKIADLVKTIIGIGTVAVVLYSIYEIFKNWNLIAFAIKVVFSNIVGIFSSFASGGISGGIEAIGSAFSGLLSPITLAIGLIVLIGAVFANLMATNKEFRDNVINWIGNIWDNLKSLGDVVFKTVGSIWDTLKDALDKLSQGGFGDFVKTLTKIIYDSIMIVIDIIKFLVPFIGGIINAIIVILTPIINFVGGIFSYIGKYIDAFLSWIRNLLEGTDESSQGMRDAWKALQDATKPIFDAIGGFFKWLGDIVNNVIGWIGDRIEDFKGFMGFLGDKIGDVVNGIVIVWNWLWDIINKVIGWIGNKIEEFKWFMGLLGDKIGDVANGIVNVWNWIADTAHNIFTGIANFFISIINGVIICLETGINFIIDGINGLAWAWNNTLGGMLDWAGVDLSVGYVAKVYFDRIPYLADGGIAYGQTLANVGEYAGASANPEVIAPLSDLTTILGKTNDDSEQIALLRQQNELLTRLLNKDTSVKVDGRTLASTVKTYDRKLGTEIIYSK